VSYIGAEPTTAAFPFDQFSGNGTTTAFTLTYAPASTTSIIVAISGVVQNPNTYSIVSNTLTFSPAPPTGTNNIAVLYLGLPVQIGTPIPGSTLELALGSASNPSLTFLGDTNTGIFSPAADTIAFTEGGTEVGRFDSSGNFRFNSGYGSVATAYACRAWVNFNGTGTVAIRASGNVTSITDNGVGDYTVNFTNAMPDANYSVTLAGMTDAITFTANAQIQTATTYVAGSVKIKYYEYNAAGTARDVTIASVAVFR
jgi:hypothetical protein